MERWDTLATKLYLGGHIGSLRVQALHLEEQRQGVVERCGLAVLEGLTQQIDDAHEFGLVALVVATFSNTGHVKFERRPSLCITDGWGVIVGDEVLLKRGRREVVIVAILVVVLLVGSSRVEEVTKTGRHVSIGSFLVVWIVGLLLLRRLHLLLWGLSEERFMLLLTVLEVVDLAGEVFQSLLESVELLGKHSDLGLHAGPLARLKLVGVRLRTRVVSAWAGTFGGHC